MAPSSPKGDDLPDPDPDLDLDLFTEPAGYYPPAPPPTTTTHTLRSGTSLTLALVGHNPLWGHHLWNGARCTAAYLEAQPALVAHRSVLELGAGAGLPALVCARLGAAPVVASDYPDPELVENLSRNVTGAGAFAEGYCWGADPAALLAHAPEGFDVLILADLLFNHSEHGKLVETVRTTMARTATAVALVFFTPYRPWLLDRDLAFFDLVRAAGFVVEKVFEEKMDEVMFKEDRGDEELRRTVFGYTVRWAL
jgi:nicotinamide N-methyltransferase